MMCFILTPMKVPDSYKKGLLTLSGQAFSLVRQALGGGGGGAQKLGRQKSRLPSTD